MGVRLLRAKYTSTSGTPPINTPFTVDREGVLQWVDGLSYAWDEERKLYACGERTVNFHDDQLTWISQYDPPPPAVGMTDHGTWIMAGKLDPLPE